MNKPFVHEHALCESNEVGPGTRVWAFAQVMDGAVVGKDCNICGHCFLEAGAVVGDRVTIKNSVQIWDKVLIEDDVFLGANCTFINDLTPRAAFKKPPEEFVTTVVGRGATIGANATIMGGIRIGKYSFVGAGSVILKDVPNFSLIVGNPGRHIGWVCVCGARLSEALECDCGRSYLQGDSGPVLRDDVVKS